MLVLGNVTSIKLISALSVHSHVIPQHDHCISLLLHLFLCRIHTEMIFLQMNIANSLGFHNLPVLLSQIKYPQGSLLPIWQFRVPRYRSSEMTESEPFMQACPYQSKAPVSQFRIINVLFCEKKPRMCQQPSDVVTARFQLPNWSSGRDFISSFPNSHTSSNISFM